MWTGPGSAREGNWALTAMGSRPPDLMVLDLGLPDIDGTEVWQADGYQLPAIASIVGAVDVWMHIIDAEAAHRNVQGLLIEVGG